MKGTRSGASILREEVGFFLVQGEVSRGFHGFLCVLSEIHDVVYETGRRKKVIKKYDIVIIEENARSDR